LEAERIWQLNGEPAAEGGYVLYWMQQAQRASFNHALEHAIRIANGCGQGVVVGFGLTDGYPDANLRHYRFMLEGLQETAATLARRGIPFVLRRGDPAEVALQLAAEASVVVCDKGYLRHQRSWRERVAKDAGRQVMEVEGEVVVPVALASDKAEIGARTLRPRILRLREEFLQPLEEERLRISTAGPRSQDDLDPADVDGILGQLRIDRSVPPSSRFRGGTGQARRRLEAFLENRLGGYATRRNEPVAQQTSTLSPYLHFGQISPVEVALAGAAARPPGDADRSSFLEELIVRRELSHNFVTYNPAYDSFDGLPRWARATLDKHRKDRREHLYDMGELEAGRTHDPYFNAAMREMRLTGFMHNYMRMYWGKKILEWSPTPEEAYVTTLRLNNRHFLCGRDPNSYANVAWLFGQHDRPWVERPIFGQVRYMNDKGLERKFDIKAYARWTEDLEALSSGHR
jgi:deoxyribodipyrimidine photo-lyase